MGYQNTFLMLSIYLYHPISQNRLTANSYTQDVNFPFLGMEIEFSTSRVWLWSDGAVQVVLM